MNTNTHTDDRVGLSPRLSESGTESGPSPKLIFITGATGFPGSHFLFWRAQRPGTFITPVRGAATDVEAVEHLLKRLEVCAASYRASFDPEDWKQRLRVFSGDVSEKSCGMDEAAFIKMSRAGVEEFWHFDEVSEFMEAGADQMRARNVSGMRHALELAAALRVRRFIYLSTAMTAGRQTGRAPEQLHSLTGEFNNIYEETKCEAEHEVTNYCRAHEIDYRILRPSIIIGPALTMKTGGCTTGFYGLLKKVFSVRDEMRAAGRSFSIAGHPQAPLNLIPVDHLMADINHLIETDFAGGPIYHLTSSHNLNVETVMRTIYEALEIGQKPVFVPPGSEISAQDGLFDRSIEPYRSYLLDGKEFERSLPRQDGVTREELYGFITEGLRELRQQSADDLFQRSWIRASDGASFCKYVGGNPDGPVVVLVNAIGIPVEIWLLITERLAPRFKILTWESRWSDKFDGAFDPQRCAVEHHVQDLLALLDSEGVDAAHIAGWCNGAQIALQFASLFPARTRSLISINGTFNLPESVPRTTFEKNLRALMPKMAGNAAYADLYHRMALGTRFKQDESGAGQGKDAGQMSGLMICRNPALRHLTGAPFRTPELLYRYANQVSQTFQEPKHAWTSEMPAPVLILSGSKDQIAHPETSREMARRIKNAELLMIEDGDHHGLHDEEQIGNTIFDFLMRFEHAAQPVTRDQAHVV